MLLEAFVFAYGLLCAAEPLRFCLDALGIMIYFFKTPPEVAPNALILWEIIFRFHLPKFKVLCKILNCVGHRRYALGDKKLGDF